MAETVLAIKMKDAEEECGNCNASKSTNGNDLKQCAKCHNQTYCSRDCQKKHWKTHKRVCGKEPSYKTINGQKMTPEVLNYGNEKVLVVTGGVLISLLSPIPPNTEYGYEFAGVGVARPFMTESAGSIDVPLTKVLCGFEMRMICCGDLSETMKETRGFVNKHAEALAIDVDVNSPSFGQSLWKSQPMGGVDLARMDTITLDVELVMIIIAYACICLKEVREVQGREAKGEVVDRKGLVKQLLNPELFKAHYVVMKDKKNAQTIKEKLRMVQRGRD